MILIARINNAEYIRVKIGCNTHSYSVAAERTVWHVAVVARGFRLRRGVAKTQCYFRAQRNGQRTR